MLKIETTQMENLQNLQPDVEQIYLKVCVILLVAALPVPLTKRCEEDFPWVGQSVQPLLYYTF